MAGQRRWFQIGVKSIGYNITGCYLLQLQILHKVIYWLQISHEVIY